MKYVGFYAGDLSIKVTAEVNEKMMPFNVIKDRWESSVNRVLESLIEHELEDKSTKVEVSLIQDYAVMNKEGDDNAAEKL